MSSKLPIREQLLALVAKLNPSRAQEVVSPSSQPLQRLQANRQGQEPRTRPEPLSPPEGGAYGAELRGLQNPAFCKSERYKAQQTRAPRAGSHPDIIEFERRLTARLLKIQVPVFAHCFLRDGKTQSELFVKGLSKAKSGQSPHNYGLAVDIVHGVKAWDLTRKQWDLIGHVGKEVAAQLGVKVEWGGDWDFYDPAHWELKAWRDIGMSWKLHAKGG